MATANSTCGVSTRLPSDLIAIDEVSRLLGVSQQTARLWASEGKMPAPFRFGKGGWRKWSRREIEAFAYGENETEKNSSLVVCYCRCSTLSQKEALARQVQRVGDYARENYPTSEIVELSDNSSGANFNRKGLLELLKLIESGRLDGGVIIAEFRDRIGRMAVALFEKIAEIRGIELVYIEAEENKTDQQLMQEDFLALIHVYNCKTYSRRGSEKLARPLDYKAIERGKELLDSGLSIRAVAKTLTDEGYGKISRHQIRRYVAINETLKRVQPKVEKTSVELFAEKAHKVDDSSRTFIGEAYAHYSDWATAMNLTVLSQKQFCKCFAGYRQVVMSKDGKNSRVWVGLQIDGVPYRQATPRAVQESSNGLDVLLGYISKAKGYRGRLSGFQTNYQNWAAEQKKESVSRSKVKTVLVQMGASLMRSNGVEMLAL